MSSILEGLYNEQDQPMDHHVGQRQEYISELRRKLEKVESILGRSTDRNGKQFNQAIQDITKNIKYLEQDELVFEIYSKMRGMAEAIGMDVAEGSPYDDEEDAVREAFNNLEAVVYNMEEPFEDYVRGLQTEVEELELDEGMYDREAFDTIFKDRKDKGSMEKPKSKSLPKDTGMYNQSNKAERDKRENDNIDEESKGLWANIHAKRKRGEKPAKPGDKEYPKTLDIDEEKQRLDPKCWDGYKKQGTKMKGGKKVNNCVPKESRIASSLRMVAEEYEREMEEGNGRLRGIAAGALLIGSLMGLNNKMAQEVYDNSHQLQQLTQIYQIAQERGDEDKMKDVKRRISNHKTRLDLGKGDVDFDGRPGNDDIKDIDYLNEPK